METVRDDIDITAPISDERLNELIDFAAKTIIDRKLEGPAVLFLEMNKPLSFMAGQAMMVALPMLGALLGPELMADMAKALSDRKNVDLLIDRIEQMANNPQVDK